jgi:hypothetical protein
MAIIRRRDDIARRHAPPTAHGPLDLRLNQHEVEELMATSAPFDDIEDAIDDAHSYAPDRI